MYTTRPNYNDPNLKLKNMYGNSIMNWIMNNVTLKFTHAVLVEMWEYFKLSSSSITQDDFKKTHLPTLSPPDKDKNHHSCLTGTKTNKGWKADDIGSISKATIAPIDMEEIRMTDPMVILREKESVCLSRNLLLKADSYYTF